MGEKLLGERVKTTARSLRSANLPRLNGQWGSVRIFSKLCGQLAWAPGTPAISLTGGHSNDSFPSSLPTSPPCLVYKGFWAEGWSPSGPSDPGSLHCQGQGSARVKGERPLSISCQTPGGASPTARTAGSTTAPLAPSLCVSMKAAFGSQS